jgi:hypothetical protein
MDEFKRISSNEWGAPNQGRAPESSNRAEQGDEQAEEERVEKEGTANQR